MNGPENAICAICGEPIDPLDRSTWQGIHGWQRIAGVRASGKHGGSDIRNRRLLQEWAHNSCVDDEKRGTTGQGGLF